MDSTSTNRTIVLAGGCFWCLEAAYLSLRGIIDVENGYAGGVRPNPTYYQVASGATGHAEVVRITYDPTIITLEQILEVFWVIHNPTTLNRQGHDVGTEYRSMILYQDESQRETALASIKDVSKLWEDPIVTEVVPLETFYLAEPEHQRYFENHPNQAYCTIVINPKLVKLREKFATLLA